MTVEECLDHDQRLDEVIRQVCQRDLATDNQKCNAVAHYGGQFVGCITNAQIVAESDALVLSAVFKPLARRNYLVGKVPYVVLL
jgi:hypothetical protein